MEMNIRTYIQRHWHEIRQKVRAVAKNHQNFDDLLNDLVVSLLEKGHEYHNDLLDKGKVQHWFVSSAHMQVNSSESPFYYKYKKFSSKSNEINEYNDVPAYEDYKPVTDPSVLISCIRVELDTYNVYERTLATEHMLNGKSYSEISREYKINRRYVSETIKPVKNESKEKLRHLWEQTF